MEEMLDNYCDDQRIGMITGFNPVGRWRAENQQYHFSYCGAIWGWASWRRMWRHYDVDMKLWADPNVRERIQNVFAHPEIYKQRMLAYDLVYRGVTDTWDYQWSVARLTQSAMSVVPAVNLVRNIGIRPDATHTKGHVGKLDTLPVLEMTFPLRLHPWVMVDRDYDYAFTAALK
ncbi:MAG: hypothetical protein C0467_17450 [Planctomycetaceae bacterium]|nr:hypothetical protein [Planctomycetaceae bacterium]